MKIGLDAKRAFLNSSGLGVYARGLISYLIANSSDDYYLFSPKKKYKQEFHTSLNERTHIVYPNSFFYQKMHSIWRSYGISQSIQDLGIELYHGLSGEIPFGLPINLKKIVTIHDLLFELRPHDYPRIDRTFYSQKAKYAAQNANKIVTISHVTKMDVVNLYKIPESKVEVIPIAVSGDLLEVSDTSPHSKPYILMVSGFIKRKNQELLIKAFDSLADKIEHDLILVGQGRDYLTKCKELALKSRNSSRIFFVEDASDNQVASFLHYASLSVYTSLYEGFGIPILESMKYRTPLLISDTPIHKEVAGDAALYYETSNLDSLRNHILKALFMSEKEKEQLIIKEFERSQEFLPEKLYPKYIELYHTT